MIFCGSQIDGCFCLNRNSNKW